MLTEFASDETIRQMGTYFTCQVLFVPWNGNNKLNQIDVYLGASKLSYTRVVQIQNQIHIFIIIETYANIFICSVTLLIGRSMTKNENSVNTVKQEQEQLFKW